MGVVKCTLTQPNRIEDRKAIIFHTYIKCEDKRCKIIIGSRNCTNDVSSNIVACLEFKFIPHHMS